MEAKPSQRSSGTKMRSKRRTLHRKSGASVRTINKQHVAIATRHVPTVISDLTLTGKLATQCNHCLFPHLTSTSTRHGELAPHLSTSEADAGRAFKPGVLLTERTKCVACRRNCTPSVSRSYRNRIAAGRRAPTPAEHDGVIRASPLDCDVDFPTAQRRLEAEADRRTAATINASDSPISAFISSTHLPPIPLHTPCWSEDSALRSTLSARIRPPPRGRNGARQRNPCR